MTRIEKLDATIVVVYNLIELKTKDFELHETCNESKSRALNSFELYRRSLDLTNSSLNESTTKRRREQDENKIRAKTKELDRLNESENETRKTKTKIKSKNFFLFLLSSTRMSF